MKIDLATPRSRWAASLPALLAVLVGCSGERAISQAISAQFARGPGARVDLSALAGGDWQRVCVLGPYSDSRRARELLGFDWDVEWRSAIVSSDSINLLLFADSAQVWHWVEHPRGEGDFSAYSGQCFSRANAVFKRDPDADSLALRTVEAGPPP